MLVLYALLQPLIAAAWSSDQDRVLAEIRHRAENLDYRMSGELTSQNVQGHRTKTRFNVKGHWFPDGLRVLVEIQDSAPSPLRVLLRMGSNGGLAIQVVLPGSTAASTLPFALIEVLPAETVTPSQQIETSGRSRGDE